jgi:NADH/NAD ratio-sensing transcriptional regulator Rex
LEAIRLKRCLLVLLVLLMALSAVRAWAEDLLSVCWTTKEDPCYHLDELEEVVANDDISIIVVSAPTKVAAQLVVPIINAGIKGVLNFTSASLNFPQGIVVENYDITTILEKVAYFVKENEENSNN